ncbi:MAG: hypothetical protein OEY20_03370 [Gemmatimonadota bacterium]|nr:hypothetical protein [Gemmatimonadota bacterium]
MDTQHFRVTLSRRDGYAFAAQFDNDAWPDIMVDESPPLGTGLGPTPPRMLAWPWVIAWPQASCSV